MSDGIPLIIRPLLRYGLFPACLLLASVSLAQTTYYVASTGNDTNDGRSATSPFQTLDKVNQLLLRPGDAVLFRGGDTFRGMLQVRQSGTADAPIRYDAYGTGTKPVLMGSVVVRNWTKIGANRWQASCSTCGSQVTGVYRNGLAQPLGRYPNADAPNRGCLTIASHVDAVELTSQQALTTDWTGAEVVLRPTYWIIDRAILTRQTANTLTINNSSVYHLTDGWGFFFQNHPATLDQSGEWYYNPATQTLQLYADQGNPNEQSITATATDQVISLNNVSFITIQNLVVSQARLTNLKAVNTNGLVLKNDEFADSGEDGIVLQGAGSRIRVENCSITNCNNNGVNIGTYQDVIFRQNTVRRIGTLVGRGGSGDGKYTAFQSSAIRNTRIENNVIDSIGYCGITVQTKSIIRQNLITNFCMTKSDGGGIYLWNGSRLAQDSLFIQSNIIQKGVGTSGGLADNTVSGAHGIFLDDCAQHVELTDNTIMNCQGVGVYWHAVSHVNFWRNTVFDNSVGQFILYNYNQCQPRNNSIKQNVFIAKTASQPVASYISGYNDLASFGRMEQNYYARPFNDLSTIGAVYNQNVVANLNLAEWQAQFGNDRTSWSSPITYKEYTVKSLSKENRLANALNLNANGWEAWSPYNTIKVNWSSENQTAKSSLTVSFASESVYPNSYGLVYKGIQAIARAKTYLVRFEASAAINKKVVVFLRQRQSPYQDLTSRYEFMAGKDRKQYEFALTSSADEADALLAFQVVEDGQPLALYNMQLQETVIEPTNPDALIRLVYNPTSRDSVIQLREPWRDIKNHYYVRQVLLKPFTSTVLLRDSLPPVDVRLSLRLERSSMRVGEVTSLSLTIHNQSPTVTLRASQVQWRCQLPANLTLLNTANLAYVDSLLTGTVSQLRTDTTFILSVKARAPGRYTIPAQVVATTYADPTSTPDSGFEDGEDDQATVSLLVRDLINSSLVTAIEPTTDLTITNLVYPNPTDDEFTFTAEADIDNIRVIDALSRQQLMVETIRRGQTIRFGQTLSNAFFLLMIHYKTGEQRTVKLIKQSR